MKLRRVGIIFDVCRDDSLITRISPSHFPLLRCRIGFPESGRVDVVVVCGSSRRPD